MSPGGPLALRVDGGGDAIVTGLTVHKVLTVTCCLIAAVCVQQTVDLILEHVK